MSFKHWTPRELLGTENCASNKILIPFQLWMNIGKSHIKRLAMSKRGAPESMKAYRDELKAENEHFW